MARLTNAQFKAAREAEAEGRRQAELKALRDEVATLRDLLRQSVNPEAHRTAMRELARRSYDSGVESGWRQGVFAALCSVDPEHTKAQAYYANPEVWPPVVA